MPLADINEVFVENRLYTTIQERKWHLVVYGKKKKNKRAVRT